MGNALVVRDDAHCLSWCLSVPSHFFSLCPTSTHLSYHRRMRILIFESSEIFSEFMCSPLRTRCPPEILRSTCGDTCFSDCAELLTSVGGFSTSHHVFHSQSSCPDDQVTLHGHVHDTFRVCLLYTRNYHCFLTSSHCVVTATAGLLAVLICVLDLLPSSVYIRESAAVLVL